RVGRHPVRGYPRRVRGNAPSTAWCVTTHPTKGQTPRSPDAQNVSHLHIATFLRRWQVSEADGGQWHNAPVSPTHLSGITRALLPEKFRFFTKLCLQAAPFWFIFIIKRSHNSPLVPSLREEKLQAFAVALARYCVM